MSFGADYSGHESPPTYFQRIVEPRWVEGALNCGSSKEGKPTKLDSDKSVNDCVKRIEFSDLCLRSMPCRHGCTITLSDGRSIETSINGVSAYVLIKALDSEKYSPHDWDHFKNYEGMASETLTAAQILSDILRKYRELN